jgi:hypothetical protein
MNELNNYNRDKQPEIYPDYVIKGVKDSLKQAEKGLLTPFTNIKAMLNLEQDQNSNPQSK